MSRCRFRSPRSMSHPDTLIQTRLGQTIKPCRRPSSPEEFQGLEHGEATMQSRTVTNQHTLLLGTPRHAGTAHVFVSVCTSYAWSDEDLGESPSCSSSGKSKIGSSFLQVQLVVRPSRKKKRSNTRLRFITL
ncbi:uncharacterized protein PV06_07585 [Exophiala oligosperma]|uniref:Uncharacterized protein n=1 Tax=Exophiala oligosperma TaxID=215243 RepID=A0A0D2BSF5_9EURO|nr:uncharacterized protein PV06_07585 [Exophiala oligosperma]KIW40382.1 hypothetical protein PV06_07585 [Exophiala oligosperma]